MKLEYVTKDQSITLLLEPGKDYFENSDVFVSYDLPFKSANGRIKAVITAKKKIVLKNFYICFHYLFENIDMLVNGYQSWTESIESSKKFALKRLKHLAHPILLKYYGDYHFYRYKNRCMHSCTYTYLKDQNNMDFFGSLNMDNCYTFFTGNYGNNTFTITSDCEGWQLEENEEALILNTFYQLQCENDSAWTDYMQNIKNYRDKIKPCTGWTSWYKYYNHVTQGDILYNLDAISSRGLPIDVFQIDDGYQKAVGDWLETNAKFKSGMNTIAKEIKNRGYKPGIWLAPFVCDKNSSIYKEHKDWLVSDAKGNLISAGYNPGWTNQFYILDIYKREVRNYLRKVFDTIIYEWGYEMLKLDFLYAVNIHSRNGKTRAQIMRDAMDFIDELCKEKWILGCGVPLSSAFGKVDYCRVGCDVAPYWENPLLEWFGYRERVSTASSLKSTLHRYRLNGKTFYNDPDVFILRNEDNKLNKRQRYTLFFLNNLLGSLIFFSDDVSTYDNNTMSLFKSMFPNIIPTINLVTEKEGVYIIYFNIEDRQYIACSNLTRKNKKTFLPEGEIFYKDRIIKINEREVVLEPYETKCYLKINELKDIRVIGSTGYVFPAAEIEIISLEKDNLVINFKPGFINDNIVYVEDRNHNVKTVNGQECERIMLDGKSVVKYIRQ